MFPLTDIAAEKRNYNSKIRGQKKINEPRSNGARENMISRGFDMDSKYFRMEYGTFEICRCIIHKDVKNRCLNNDQLSEDYR